MCAVGVVVGGRLAQGCNVEFSRGRGAVVQGRGCRVLGVSVAELGGGCAWWMRSGGMGEMVVDGEEGEEGRVEGTATGVISCQVPE